MSLTTYEVDDRGVALIQLDRANALNAINVQMLVEMLEHIAVARSDENVRALVFSSTDYMAFSAGAVFLAPQGHRNGDAVLAEARAAVQAAQLAGGGRMRIFDGPLEVAQPLPA